MQRYAPAALLAFVPALPGVASAQEYRSETAFLSFQDRVTVLEQQYEIPLTFDIIQGVIEDIGVVATLGGSSDLGILMEAESEVTWPDPTGVGDVVHEIIPLPGSGYLGFTSNVNFETYFTLTVLGSTINLTLLTQDITFENEVEAFDPFLLPGESPSSMFLQADPTSGLFELPIQLFDLSLGIFTVAPGVVIRGRPESYAQVRGTQVATDYASEFYVATQQLEPVPVSIYENTGNLEFATSYEANVTTDLGYTIEIALDVDITVFGFDVGFEVGLADFPVPLFFGFDTVEFRSQSYDHPIPTFRSSIDTIDFGTVEVGKSATFEYLIANEGELELEGLAAFDGPAAISVAPAEFGADPGRTTAPILTFRPTEAGEYEGTLLLETSDPTMPLVEVPVIGKAVLPAVDDPFGNENDDDFGSLYDDQGSSLYSTCGCAAQTVTPRGLVLFLPLVPLLALRRRRRG